MRVFAMRWLSLLMPTSYVLAVKVEQLRGRAPSEKNHVRKRTLHDASRVLKHKSKDSVYAYHEPIPVDYYYQIPEYIPEYTPPDYYEYPDPKAEYNGDIQPPYDAGYNYPEYEETGQYDHHPGYYYDAHSGYYPPDVNHNVHYETGHSKDHLGYNDEHYVYGYHDGYHEHYAPDYYVYYYEYPSSKKKSPKKKKSKKHTKSHYHMAPYVRWQPIWEGKGHHQFTRWPAEKPTPVPQPVAAKTRSPTPPTFVPAPVFSIPPVEPPVVSNPPVSNPPSALVVGSTMPVPPVVPPVLPPAVVPPVQPPVVNPPVDSAGNSFGLFIGSFDDGARFGAISILYNASGIFALYGNLGCGNRQPITPRVEPGLLEWTEGIEFGTETCANGNVTLTESLDGLSWDYLWIESSSDSGISTGVLNAPVVDTPVLPPIPGPSTTLTPSIGGPEPTAPVTPPTAPTTPVAPPTLPTAPIAPPVLPTPGEPTVSTALPTFRDSSTLGPTAGDDTTSSDAPSSSPFGEMDPGSTLEPSAEQQEGDVTISPTSTFPPSTTNPPTFVYTIGPTFTAFPTGVGSGGGAGDAGSTLPSIVTGSLSDTMEETTSEDEHPSSSLSPTVTNTMSLPPTIDTADGSETTNSAEEDGRNGDSIRNTAPAPRRYTGGGQQQASSQQAEDESLSPSSSPSERPPEATPTRSQGAAGGRSQMTTSKPRNGEGSNTAPAPRRYTGGGQQQASSQQAEDESLSPSSLPSEQPTEATPTRPQGAAAGGRSQMTTTGSRNPPPTTAEDDVSKEETKQPSSSPSSPSSAPSQATILPTGTFRPSSPTPRGPRKLFW